MIFIIGAGVLAVASESSDGGGKKVVKFDKDSKVKEAKIVIDQKSPFWKSIKDLLHGKAKPVRVDERKKVVKFGDNVVVCEGDCDEDCGSCGDCDGDCGSCGDCCGDCDGDCITCEDCCGDCDGDCISCEDCCADCEVECDVICELLCDGADCDEDVQCIVGKDGKKKVIRTTRRGNEVTCEETCDGTKSMRKIIVGDKEYIIAGGTPHEGNVNTYYLTSDGKNIRDLTTEGHHIEVIEGIHGDHAEVILEQLHGGKGYDVMKIPRGGECECDEDCNHVVKKYMAVPRAVPQAPIQDTSRKMQHLHAAAESLHAAGMHEEAEKLLQKAKSFNKVRRVPAPRQLQARSNDIHQAIQDLRQQVRELNQVVRDLKKRVEGMKGEPARYRLRRTSEGGEIIGIGGGQVPPAQDLRGR
jgi:hypothetical protein